MTETSPYLRPTALTVALDALASGDWRIAAGCTDLFPATEHKALQGPVLDISGIAALRGISQTDQGVRIGATTTWTDLIKAPLPSSFAGLQLAAREVGAAQIQNRGTIAGNLCNASPAADGVPPLLTLDAIVELQSANATRQMPLQDFLVGPRQTQLATTEMVTALLVPKSALAGHSHFLKLGARAYLVISIAMTAARLVLRDGVVTEAALAVGSCGPVATRLNDIETKMIGQPIDPDMVTDDLVAAAITPIGDMRADSAYRAVGAAELLRRTIKVLASEQRALA
jgi:CO/xanthine dehydrogenase FAD-binding subunit